MKNETIVSFSEFISSKDKDELTEGRTSKAEKERIERRKAEVPKELDIMRAATSMRRQMRGGKPTSQKLKSSTANIEDVVSKAEAEAEKIIRPVKKKRGQYDDEIEALKRERREKEFMRRFDAQLEKMKAEKAAKLAASKVRNYMAQEPTKKEREKVPPPQPVPPLGRLNDPTWRPPGEKKKGMISRLISKIKSKVKDK